MTTRYAVGEGYPVAELSVPSETTGGVPVTIVREPIDDGHRLHASAADGTVYLELSVHPEEADVASVVAAEREWLDANATGQTIGPVEPAVVAGRAGTGFDFHGTVGGARRTRRFRYLGTDPGLVRIVLDPTSPTNRSILASLVVRDAAP